ncbi:MAG: hypothetical protein NTV54_07055 [Ignavibacteriales bacterium]|nr:hypothetical protein [Ignavibacteriales bacterium]
MDTIGRELNVRHYFSRGLHRLAKAEKELPFCRLRWGMILESQQSAWLCEIIALLFVDTYAAAQ